MHQQQEFKSRARASSRLEQVSWIITILLVSTVAGLVCDWLVPGVGLYSRDLLVRARGTVAPPDDIAIVAIDESSISRLGRYPWKRSQIAHVVDLIAAAGPRAIALDVLYSELSTEVDDNALAGAVARSGNTVLAAQLVDRPDERGERQIEWLRPLPMLERQAAGVGHLHISTDADGTGRELPLRKADDEGQPLWSLAIETVRVGERLSAADVRDVSGAVRLGKRTLPVADEQDSLSMFSGQNDGERGIPLRSDPLLIDYIGPPGSFAPHVFSFADVLDGKIPAENLRGKYVLIGATAATLGDGIASPFTHSEGKGGDQHGTLMPGVEVLANSINTILRERFYSEAPIWLAALCAALVAAAVLVCLSLCQGRLEMLKQAVAFAGLGTAVLLTSYYAFTHWLLIPPTVPSLVAFATAVPLALLRRSLATSADLDERIAELSSSGKWLSARAEKRVVDGELHSSPASLIARLVEADAVSIFARGARSSSDYRLVAASGIPYALSIPRAEVLQARAVAVNFGPAHSVPAHNIVRESNGLSFDQGIEGNSDRLWCTLTVRLDSPEDPLGALVITHRVNHELESETLRLCAELATGYVRQLAGNAPDLESERSAARFRTRWRLPRGVEWKAQALGGLQRRMLAHTQFVDRALRSVRDGLLVAEIDGRILFANRRAAEIFGVSERAIIGSDLFQRISRDGETTQRDDGRSIGRTTREILARLVVEHRPVEREIMIGDAPPRYYMLRLSTVSDDDDGTAFGLVASLSDITEQRELQQTKNDVMMLVTHELKTPLTAIQGMSEVLADHDVEKGRQREMHLAINDEAKRLARLINDYLDITRLESGARPLRLVPVRVAPLVERALLMLDPLAAERGMRVTRRFAPNLGPIIVDADLLAQAVTNLVANAIKYSRPDSEVIVELSAENDYLWMKVVDQGPGIPGDALSLIFEKFYRVPCIENADVSGNGLGLAFVREIAEKHGGYASVESEQGIGSVFSLRLPLSPRAIQATPAT